MRFGVREICEVVLRAKATMHIGNKTFFKDEPVLYFDSLTTSSLEGAATTVYAQGGRGNARLLAWEGERTLTFNMTDALISPESFMILSGAGLVDATAEKPIYVHTTYRGKIEKEANGTKAFINVPGKVVWNHTHGTNNPVAGADIFLMAVNGNEMSEPEIPSDTNNSTTLVYHDNTEAVESLRNTTDIECYAFATGQTVLVDYYVEQKKAKQIEITPDKFGGFFYLEASTLFRDEETGADLPAEFIIPRCKLQSNFTFSMAATGDPSTFDFVLDAFPDYTKFDTSKKVLAVIQIVEDASVEEEGGERAHHNGTQPTAADSEFDHKTFYTYNDGNYDQANGNTDKANSNFKSAPITVDAPAYDASVATLGKSVSDFQTGFTVNGKTITVTPIEVTTPWTEGALGWDEDTDEGYYVAFDVKVEGATRVTAELNRSASIGVPKRDAVINGDRDTVVFFLGADQTDAETAQSVTITAIVNGTTKTETYNLVLNF